MAELLKWKCVICGQDVIEGQRFFYVPGKGYAHAECYYEKLLEGKEPMMRDIIALMDANEVLSYAIVRLKEAARVASSSEVKDAITRTRREIEMLAEKLETHPVFRSEE